MIVFDYNSKQNKGHIKCNTDILGIIREHFSVDNPGAVFARKYNKFIPSRKYIISATGTFNVGLFDEIKKFIEEKKLGSIVLSDIFERQLENKLNYKISPLKIELRDYQTDIIKNCLNKGKGVTVLGTGGGKTLTIATLIQTIYDNTKDNHLFKCLIIVPDLGLVNQTYQDFIDYGVSFKVGKWTGSHELDITNNIIIANISIIQSRIEDNDWIKFVDLLIVDEAHKIKAEISSKIIKTIITPHKFGFTGTLPIDNYDRWSVLGLLGSVLYEKKSYELRNEQFLVNVEAKIYNFKYNKHNPISSYKDELDFIYKHSFRNRFINKICDKINNNILILVNHIEHGEELYNNLKSLANKQVYFIQGSIEVEERDKIKKLMETDNNVVCIAISAIFSTGINITNLHYIMFTAGGKSFIRTVQSIGRGLRKHPTKEKLYILDIADHLKYSTRHLETRKKIYTEEKINFSEQKVVEN